MKLDQLNPDEIKLLESEPKAIDDVAQIKNLRVKGEEIKMAGG